CSGVLFGRRLPARSFARLDDAHSSSHPRTSDRTPSLKASTDTAAFLDVHSSEDLRHWPSPARHCPGVPTPASHCARYCRQSAQRGRLETWSARVRLVESEIGSFQQLVQENC